MKSLPTVRSILSTLDAIAEENKTTISSDIISAIEVLHYNLTIDKNGKGAVKGFITSTKIMSINISLKKILNDTHKLVSLKSIELLKLDDAMHIEDDIERLQAA